MLQDNVVVRRGVVFLLVDEFGSCFARTLEYFGGRSSPLRHPNDRRRAKRPLAKNTPAALCTTWEYSLRTSFLEGSYLIEIMLSLGGRSFFGL